MLFNKREQKESQEEKLIIEKKEQGSFYYIKDNKSRFLVITLGYKDKYPSRNLEAKIAPVEGSNLFSFKMGKNDFIYYDPEMPLADYVTGMPILFPFPNRIEDAMWTWKGKTYLQKKNGIPIQLHSLVYDERWEYTPTHLKESLIFVLNLKLVLLMLSIFMQSLLIFLIL